MWVLSTDRAELHFVGSPEDIPDEYATLSHTWNNKPQDGPPEQSFHDIQKIQKGCARTGRNPRDFVSEKIRRCCELAEKHGYKWVWIDTCCIDKTSSAELSEAINSMYRYYALAAICYGYLRDVDTVFFSHEDLKKQRDLPQPFSDPSYRQLWSSIWFQRGWTLQELIAPRFFVFVSRTWEVIGTKADLAEFLETKFRIPAAVHRLHASPSEFSIAQRMSWFGLRQTARPEDEAYCLLGLFEIHMPPLYGEGRNAFRRLQEEIMKQSVDTTLFAWRGVLTDSPVECLFAASPADFTEIQKQNEIVYTPPRRTQVPAETTGNDPALGVRADMIEMTFAVTPTGVRANIPIFTWRGGLFGDLYWSSGDGRPVFLHLEPDPDSEASSSRRTSYRVGEPRLTGSEEYDDACPPDGPPSWKEVIIRHRPPLHRAPGQLPVSATFRFTPAIPMQLTLDAPVRFPEARIWQFLIQSESDRFEIRGAGLESPWTAESTHPVAYVFVGLQYTIIRIGRCHQDGPPGEQRRPEAIWATLSIGYVGDNDIEGEAEISKVSADTLHDCSQDHVLQWPNLRKRFTIPFKKEVTLSFTPCPLNPERTLVLEASCRLSPLPGSSHQFPQTSLSE
ncbi:HET-domain-containing protein [Polyporus arcularius HHB13444]|uniref:HET-domain-containing protein n=1 Tax=Polyporus arcularius HHB13444 TaxID=1314778 RepID=A0A5C3NYI1_9APHY|nr:HET-domain-containing protein [Polyporus arcularius HHB13444]